MPTHEEKICQRCNSIFECKVGNINNCQCSSIVLSDDLQNFLDNSFFDCLCINCLADLNSKLTAILNVGLSESSNYQEGVHFYMDGANFVFTETYFLLRGHCCRSGCRHCPYGFLKH